MKSFVPPVFLLLFVLFGGFLLLEIAKPPHGSAGPLTLHQTSETALFTIKDPVHIEQIQQQGLVVKTEISDPTTLIRIVGNVNPIHLSRFESPGEVLIINPGGIMVGEEAILLPQSDLVDTLAAPTGSNSGNGYTLAIEEGSGSYIFPIKSKNTEFPDSSGQK